MAWIDLNAGTIQQHLNRNWDDAAVPINRKNIVSLSDDAILKIGPEHCRADYAWLKVIQSLQASEGCSIPDWVRVPKLRSQLVEFTWEGLHLYGFAMEKINFPTLAEVTKIQPINDELADRIVEGLVSLRTGIAIIKTSDAVPGLDKCLLQGHMFPPNEDSCWTVSSQDDVKQTLEEKVGDSNDFNGLWEWAWGDCGPENIYVSLEAGKTICYADLGYAMRLPRGYDLWTLKVSHYSPNFTAPLIRAFARKDSISSSIHFEAFTKMRNRYRKL